MNHIKYYFFLSILSLTQIMCSKSSYNAPVTPPPSGTTVTVTIAGMAFSPASLTIKTGTTVIWKNNDATTHTATSDDGTTFNTGNILPTYSSSVIINKTGTFTYHCSIHSSMTATIIVTP